MKFKKKELWTFTKLKLNIGRREKKRKKKRKKKNFFSKAIGSSMVDVKVIR